MSDNIPFEIQTEIMINLPVESLVVFRSVSKTWKLTIDSPAFISKYNNLRRHHRLLIRYDDYKHVSYIDINDNDTLSQQHAVRNVSMSLESFMGQLIVGTSQGLLCIFGNLPKNVRCYKEIAVIWNPSLRKSISIHVPYEKNKISSSHLGFGVCPGNCDPMIVMINSFRKPFPVLVFTLSSRVWRVSRGNPPPESIYSRFLSPVPTDDRCMYWLAEEMGIQLVVAFDMLSEDFTKINVPHSVAHRSKGEVSISKIRESLAVLEFDFKKQVYDVWMMGVSKSFTKLFTINIRDALYSYELDTKVLGFRKNDQAIMETTREGYKRLASLDVYEPRTGTIKSLGIDVDKHSALVSSYTETLLLLDQLDDQFIKIQLQV